MSDAAEDQSEYYLALLKLKSQIKSGERDIDEVLTDEMMAQYRKIKQEQEKNAR